MVLYVLCERRHFFSFPSQRLIQLNLLCVSLIFSVCPVYLLPCNVTTHPDWSSCIPSSGLMLIMMIIIQLKDRRPWMGASSKLRPFFELWKHKKQVRMHIRCDNNPLHDTAVSLIEHVSLECRQKYGPQQNKRDFLGDRINSYVVN